MSDNTAQMGEAEASHPLMNTLKQIDLGESAYSRRKQVALVENAHCDKCQRLCPKVLCFDTSDGEYGSLDICRDCILRLIDVDDST